jgi:hypothetical protein
MAVPRCCSSVRSGLEARGAATQKPRATRGSREARAARRWWIGEAHWMPAPFPAAGCSSRCRASSRDTGRTGNRRGGKVGGRRRRWSWHGWREPRRERLIFPPSSSRTSCPGRWSRCQGPRNARQNPARGAVARASIIGQGKLGGLGNSVRLASSLSRRVAINAG